MQKITDFNEKWGYNLQFDEEKSWNSLSLLQEEKRKFHSQIENLAAETMSIDMLKALYNLTADINSLLSMRLDYLKLQAEERKQLRDQIFNICK